MKINYKKSPQPWKNYNEPSTIFGTLVFRTKTSLRPSLHPTPTKNYFKLFFHEMKYLEKIVWYTILTSFCSNSPQRVLDLTALTFNL